MGSCLSLASLANEILDDLIEGEQFGVVEVCEERLKLLPEQSLNGNCRVPVCRTHAVAGISELESVLLLLPVLGDLRDNTKDATNS